MTCERTPASESVLGRLSLMDEKVEHLRQQIDATEAQLRDLKVQLQTAELKSKSARQTDSAKSYAFNNRQNGDALNGIRYGKGTHEVPESPLPLDPTDSIDARTSRRNRWPLEDDEYKRYGRQLIMPEVGLDGQLLLKNSKVLLVGVGGLGCPAAVYLAGAGVGTLGLMDGDTVDESNLHRQIAHVTERVGWSKVDSAVEHLRACVKCMHSGDDRILIFILGSIATFNIAVTSSISHHK